jgi:transcriptional regulator with XRE-family HTH domain
MDLITARLKLLRQRHGLTQEQVAELTGLAYKHYQSIEAGRRKQIWLETVDRLAAAYQLETYQLLSPELPEDSELVRQPTGSNAHYRDRKPANGTESVQ